MSNAIPHNSGQRHRTACWLAAAALLALELGVLALVTMPRVSAAYADFYIRQSTVCLAPGGLPVVKLGRTVSATSRFALSQCLIDAGWLKPRSIGTFLRDGRGSLTFRLDQQPVGDIRFSFIAFAIGREPPPSISVFAGGKDIGTVRLSHDSLRVHSVVIPKAVLAGDRVTITFALQPDGHPRARRLSLLRWRLDPVDAPLLTALSPPGYY